MAMSSIAEARTARKSSFRLMCLRYLESSSLSMAFASSSVQSTSVGSMSVGIAQRSTRMAR